MSRALNGDFFSIFGIAHDISKDLKRIKNKEILTTTTTTTTERPEINNVRPLRGFDYELMRYSNSPQIGNGFEKVVNELLFRKSYIKLQKYIEKEIAVNNGSLTMDLKDLPPYFFYDNNPELNMIPLAENKHMAKRLNDVLLEINYDINTKSQKPNDENLTDKKIMDIPPYY